MVYFIRKRKVERTCGELKIMYLLYGLSIRNPIRKARVAEPLYYSLFVRWNCLSGHHELENVPGNWNRNWKVGWHARDQKKKNQRKGKKWSWRENWYIISDFVPHSVRLIWKNAHVFRLATSVTGAENVITECMYWAVYVNIEFHSMWAVLRMQKRRIYEMILLSHSPVSCHGWGWFCTPAGDGGSREWGCCGATADGCACDGPLKSVKNEILFETLVTP